MLLKNKTTNYRDNSNFRSYLKIVEAMPETTFDEVVDKCVEMNAVHPVYGGQWSFYPHLA